MQEENFRVLFALLKIMQLYVNFCGGVALEKMIKIKDWKFCNVATRYELLDSPFCHLK